MSKMQVAIIQELENSNWMTATEIAAASHYPLPSVRVSLAKLEQEGVVSKKDNPAVQFGKLYRKSGVASGFGVSHNMARFYERVNPVRARYAATN